MKAIDAVEYMLRRIRDDKKVGYLIGPGTEGYSRLVQAYAAEHGKTEELREQGRYPDMIPPEEVLSWAGGDA